jgi:4-nitrophenyl phosphatase
MNKINLSKKELLIFDLDGVIYKGPQIINHVQDSINKFYNINKQIIFFTNNSTLTTKAYVKKLTCMGIACNEKQFYTSATISADFLKKEYSGQISAFVIGEEGLMETLESRGISVLNRIHDEKQIIENKNIECDFVIAGLDRDFTYKKLASGTQLISRGADFYATNDDATLPEKFGNMPGAGTIINAVSTAIGSAPKKIFGKPSPAGIYQILSDLSIKSEHAIMFGDRPETDILSAIRAGIDTALVLTGIINKENLNSVPIELKPDIILNNLSEF